jgi:hypothetical protein
MGDLRDLHGNIDYAQIWVYVSSYDCNPRIRCDSTVLLETTSSKKCSFFWTFVNHLKNFVLTVSVVLAQ